MQSIVTAWHSNQSVHAPVCFLSRLRTTLALLRSQVERTHGTPTSPGAAALSTRPDTAPALPYLRTAFGGPDWPETGPAAAHEPWTGAFGQHHASAARYNSAAADAQAERLLSPTQAQLQHNRHLQQSGIAALVSAPSDLAHANHNGGHALYSTTDWGAVSDTLHRSAVIQRQLAEGAACADQFRPKTTGGSPSSHGHAKHGWSPSAAAVQRAYGVALKQRARAMVMGGGAAPRSNLNVPAAVAVANRRMAVTATGELRQVSGGLGPNGGGLRVAAESAPQRAVVVAGGPQQGGFVVAGMGHHSAGRVT